MRTYDFTPLFRSTIGFDRWSDLFDAALRADENGAGYPPYNIEKMGDDKYRIMMAVAGFGENDIEITAQENLLVVSGNLGEPREGGEAGAQRVDRASLDARPCRRVSAASLSQDGERKRLRG